MATANFISEVWSQKLKRIFDDVVVMASLVNTDYEGDIQSAGDVVHIRTFGDVTVNDYTRDMTISFQALTDPMVDLTIDQQKYFAFKVDDLDKAQSNIDILNGYAGRGAIAIRDVVDSRLIGHHSDVDSGNVLGTDVSPIALSSSNIYDYITQMSEVLDESKMPQEDRHLVITPKFKTMLLQSTEFTRATSLGDNIVQNGYIGNVAGFNVHVTTNNPADSGVINLMGFHKDMIAFASQVSKVETVRPYNMFADAVKGLYLYGSKVIHSTAGVVLKAAE